MRNQGTGQAGIAQPLARQPLVARDRDRRERMPRAGRAPRRTRAAMTVGRSPTASTPSSGVVDRGARGSPRPTAPSSWNRIGIAASCHGSSSTWQRSVAKTRSTPSRSAASPNARSDIPSSSRAAALDASAPSILSTPAPSIQHHGVVNQSYLLRIRFRAAVPRLVQVRHGRAVGHRADARAGAMPARSCARALISSNTCRRSAVQAAADERGDLLVQARRRADRDAPSGRSASSDRTARPPRAPRRARAGASPPE